MDSRAVGLGFDALNLTAESKRNLLGQPGTEHTHSTL
jgi:hypothetical protein